MAVHGRHLSQDDKDWARENWRAILPDHESKTGDLNDEQIRSLAVMCQWGITSAELIRSYRLRNMELFAEPARLKKEIRAYHVRPAAEAEGDQYAITAKGYGLALIPEREWSEPATNRRIIDRYKQGLPLDEGKARVERLEDLYDMPF